MKLTQQQYFRFKYTQMIIAGVVVFTTLILVAIPKVNFTVDNGIELLAAFAAIHWISNGVIKDKSVQEGDKMSKVNDTVTLVNNYGFCTRCKSRDLYGVYKNEVFCKNHWIGNEKKEGK